MKIYRVFYDGVSIGLVRAKDVADAETKGYAMAIQCTLLPSGQLYGVAVDLKLITVDDKDQWKYRHLI